MCSRIMSLDGQEVFTIGLFFRLQELDVDALKASFSHIHLYESCISD